MVRGVPVSRAEMALGRDDPEPPQITVCVRVLSDLRHMTIKMAACSKMKNLHSKVNLLVER